MLLLIITTFISKLPLEYLNTSNVTVNLKEAMKAYTNKLNLNTSNVTVNLM